MNLRSKNKPKEEILLGIDYGEANIGLAFGRSELVNPLKVINAKDENVAIGEISRIVLENNVTTVVIGLPLSVEGKETLQSKQVRKFANLLKIHLKKPIQFVNEYETSRESARTMLGLGMPKKKREVVDHFSAALILKHYYNNNVA